MLTNDGNNIGPFLILYIFLNDWKMTTTITTKKGNDTQCSMSAVEVIWWDCGREKTVFINIIISLSNHSHTYTHIHKYLRFVLSVHISCTRTESRTVPLTNTNMILFFYSGLPLILNCIH